MREDLFAELLASVGEMGEIRRGARAPSRVFDVPAPVPAGAPPAPSAVSAAVHAVPDAAALRARFGLSQAKFAALLGISARTLQDWEQGRRTPEGPARVLLCVAERHPAAVLDAVHTATGPAASAPPPTPGARATAKAARPLSEPPSGARAGRRTRGRS